MHLIIKGKDTGLMIASSRECANKTINNFDSPAGYCNLQLRFASVDLELHTKYVPGEPELIYAVDQRVCKQTQVLPPLADDKFLCSFSHIFAGSSLNVYQIFGIKAPPFHLIPIL